MAKEMNTIRTERNRHTDVMYVDIAERPAHSRIDTIEVGHMVGFPGQILAHIDRDNGTFYGLTIQNYSGLRWRMKSRYWAASTRRILDLIVMSIKAGVCIDERRHLLPNLVA